MKYLTPRPPYILLAQSLAEYMCKEASGNGFIPEGFTVPTLSVLKTQALLIRDRVSITNLALLAQSHGFIYKQCFRDDYSYQVVDVLPKSTTFRFHLARLIQTINSYDFVIVQSKQIDKYFLYNNATKQVTGKCRKEFVIYLACENRLKEVDVIINKQSRRAFRLQSEVKPKPLFSWDFQPAIMANEPVLANSMNQ
jgi:hypothetical protein